METVDEDKKKHCVKIEGVSDGNVVFKAEVYGKTADDAWDKAKKMYELS